MAGEGEVLRKTREEKGLSYHDVEDSIKIRVRYLEALEKEEYNILPGITYTKGFLRSYSKYLGLNPEEIISLFNSSIEKETESELQPPLTPIQSTPVWFKPIVLIMMALFAVAIVIGITFFTKMNNNPPGSDYTPTPLPTAPEIQKPIDQEPESTKPIEQPSEVKYEGIVAELVFKEDCWLKVKVDGAMMQDGIMAAGTTKVIQGAERIEFLTIGNAGGLTLKLNGKDVPPLGASKEVIRNYVVTLDTIRNM